LVVGRWLHQLVLSGQDDDFDDLTEADLSFFAGDDDEIDLAKAASLLSGSHLLLVFRSHSIFASIALHFRDQVALELTSSRRMRLELVVFCHSIVGSL
jgi:hypothetical protein